MAALIRQHRLEKVPPGPQDDAGAPAGVGHSSPMGFADPAHVNRLFRRVYGLSPGEFRLAHVSGR